ncbi:hypothetical protein SLEP1_g55081 [Rubroshorea leprosula]|uniref:Uncharacterized protein n=1 Tax=Rubroshorea leprosula TaxID=152421 RepID=A0AAV5MFJ3_9ROSI|nr:hypothetical protein SLEP1_g55081 [Rubroshorea leprosula]
MFHGRGLRLSLQDAVLMHFINMGTFSLTPKEVNNGADIVWLAVISTY